MLLRFLRISGINGNESQNINWLLDCIRLKLVDVYQSTLQIITNSILIYHISIQMGTQYQKKTQLILMEQIEFHENEIGIHKEICPL